MNTALFIDHYELAMAQGYYMLNMHKIPARFDYFFRTPPFNGGFAVFAGLETFIEMIQNFLFESSDCDYLESLGFNPGFLEYLRNFSFKGTIDSVREGEIVFPNEPIVSVSGTLIETQMLETMLLNVLNFESLIATKAARMRLAAGDIPLIDFGLRRAQGNGGIQATRASMIGGFNNTSNVLSGKRYSIGSSGTMAHSWVQAFDTEYEAFKAYAQIYPENTILLVDTFDSLTSGIPNAIKVAWEMQEKGLQLKGIRLDSGDLSYLSKKARYMLNAAGLHNVSIMVSNQLDEYIIQSLIDEKAPIDAFGVGTSLVTGKPDAALDGVYKLVELNEKPVMKFSENISKATLPGSKNVFRYIDTNNTFQADGICMTSEIRPNRLFHPITPEKNSALENLERTKLLEPVIDNGNRTKKTESLKKISDYQKKRMEQLPSEHKRFVNPHEYKVGISKKLMDQRNTIKEKIKTDNEL